MGTGTLTSSADGDIIPASDHNQLVNALLEEIVPRDTTKAPVDEGGQLGTSLYRFLYAYVTNYFIGTAANNLKIYEGATGEIWLERANAEIIKMRDGQIDIIGPAGDTIAQFNTITNKGLVGTGIQESSVPRTKIINKPFAIKGPNNGSRGGLGAIAGMDCSISVVAGRKYIAAMNTESSSVTGTMRFYFTGAGTTAGSYRNITAPASSFHHEYVFQASVTGTVTFVPYAETASWVGLYTSFREI